MKIVPAGATVSTGDEVGSKRGAQCVPGQSSVGPMDVVTSCGSSRLHMLSSKSRHLLLLLVLPKALDKCSLDKRGITYTAAARVALLTIENL